MNKKNIFSLAIISLFLFPSFVANAQTDPSRYGIDVIQVGGIGSHTLTKDAFYLEERGYLNPPENYVSTLFNSPGDLMWVSCKGGYTVESANSPTNNQFTIDSINGVGVTIEDKLKNSIIVICTNIPGTPNPTSAPVVPTNSSNSTWLWIVGGIIFIAIVRSIWANISKNKTTDSNNDGYFSSTGQEQGNKKEYRNKDDSEVKSLYKKAIHKYHPDKAQSEEDKRFRNDLTAKLNKAYQEGDIETLRMFQ